MLANRPRQPESEVVIDCQRPGVQTGGRAQEVRLVVETAAAQDPAVHLNHLRVVFPVFDRGFLTPRSAVDTSLLAPLPNIAMHVEESEIIWLQPANGLRPDVGVG